MAEPAQALGERQKHPPPIYLLWHVSLLAIQHGAATPHPTDDGRGRETDTMAYGPTSHTSTPTNGALRA
eukprot:523264-Prymnesium_polylepis.1